MKSHKTCTGSTSLIGHCQLLAPVPVLTDTIVPNTGLANQHCVYTTDSCNTVKLLVLTTLYPSDSDNRRILKMEINYTDGCSLN